MEKARAFFRAIGKMAIDCFFFSKKILLHSQKKKPLSGLSHYLRKVRV